MFRSIAKLAAKTPPRQARLPRPRDVVRIYSDKGAGKGRVSEPAVVIGRRKTRTDQGPRLDLDVVTDNGARQRVPFTPQTVDMTRGDPVIGRVRTRESFHQIARHGLQQARRQAPRRDDDEAER